jgi:hypothetical protein
MRRCRRVLNVAGDQCVVTDDSQLGVSGEERADNVASLRLPGVVLQPAVKARLPSEEVLDLLALGIERLDGAADL